MIPKDKDKRPPGSACGQKKEDGGRGGRGTSSFGTDARLFDFPQMITTEWQVSIVWECVSIAPGKPLPEGGAVHGSLQIGTLVIFCDKLGP